MSKFMYFIILIDIVIIGINLISSFCEDYILTINGAERRDFQTEKVREPKSIKYRGHRYFRKRVRR